MVYLIWITQIRVARSQRLRQNDPIELYRRSTKFRQRRSFGLWWRARLGGERHSRPARRLHAARIGLVRRIHHQGDARVLWPHLQTAYGFRQIADGVPLRPAGPTTGSSFRQDVERWPATTSLLRCRSLPRTRTSHPGRTDSRCRSLVETKVCPAVFYLFLCHCLSFFFRFPFCMQIDFSKFPASGGGYTFDCLCYGIFFCWPVLSRWQPYLPFKSRQAFSCL